MAGEDLSQHRVTALPASPAPNSIYWVKGPGTSRTVYVTDAAGVPEKFPNNKARIVQSGRVYCYTNNRWVSLTDDNYGLTYYQYTENGGTGNDPILEWEVQGIPFEEGDHLNSIQLRARANNINVPDMEYAFYWVQPDTPARWVAGFDNDGEIDSTLLARNLYKTPLPAVNPSTGELESPAPLTGNMNDRMLRDVPIGFTAPARGELRLFMRPVGVITQTRYFLVTYTIDYEIKA